MKIKSYLILVGVVVVLYCSMALSAYGQEKAQPKFSAGLNLGYYGGFGLQAFGKVTDFADDFPLAGRIGIGYTAVGPGSALDARRIFINDATNGTPDKSGRIWDFRFDFLYPTSFLSLNRAFFFAGPRYSRFNGNFKFIGGNEDFDVSTNQWGLGIGLESYYHIRGRFDMVITGGLDYYFSSKMYGHDTSYSPDGTDENGRNDYTYDDADEAIGQPKIEPRLMMGFNYRF